MPDAISGYTQRLYEFILKVKFFSTDMRYALQSRCLLDWNGLAAYRHDINGLHSNMDTILRE